MTELYRHFDSDGRLLYVGISLNWAARLNQHMTKSEWAHLICMVTIQRFPTLAEARKAERDAIKNEKPMFNKGQANSVKIPALRSIRSFEATPEVHQMLEAAVAAGLTKTEVINKALRQYLSETENQ